MSGRKDLSIRLAVFMFMLALVLAVPAAAVTRYVSPGQSIQAAINDSNDGDEIEVSPGTYNEAINFIGKAIRLYSSGGPEVTTIDATGLSSSVVNCESGEGLNTILAGFTITGGTGTPDSYGQLCGGGMRNESSSPTVTNCIFTNNSAEFGGGLFNYAGSAKVSDCSFKNNTVSHWGAGLYNNDSSPTVTNCTFSGNTATEFGGGMYNGNSSNPTVSDCNFSENSAGSSAGGMYNGGSSPTVTDCKFSGNEAGYGGGMSNYHYSSPTVINCTFSGNTATVVGGGMTDANNSNPTVINGKFSGNTAAYGAGIHGNFSSSPTMINCAFSDNMAGTDGGGMYNTNSCNPTLTNCTFSGNSAGSRGGAIFCYNSSPTLTNCILWGDAPYEFYNSGGTPAVTYSDVQGGYGGAGNINADPCFVNAAGGDLRLLYDSPCIDNGDNSAPALVATDLAGNGRLFDGNGNGSTIVDMGAYELGSLKLLAHFKLDESSGDTACDSAGDNHGILAMPPVWQPAGGFHDGALLFDGVDDYVFIPNESNFDITDEITVSAWIKVTAFDRPWQAIVTKGDTAWRLHRLRDTDRIAFHCNSYWGAEGNFNVYYGWWHHIAGVYDGTRAYLYVDASLDVSQPASGLINKNDFPVMIGENAEKPGRWWNGLIDDVAIFSRALNKDPHNPEIWDLMHLGGAFFIELGDPNLKALWELDEGSGGTALDSAGDNHGTLVPNTTPPLWQPVGGMLGGALEFDGVDDCVSIPNESRFDITYQLTVSAWIKVIAFDESWQAIVTKGDTAWRLHRLRDTASVAFHCNIFPYWGADGSVNVADGQWHHVAGVYDAKRAYLYVDGLLDNSEPVFAFINKNDFPVKIGENAERPGRCFSGLIDDVRIYTCGLGPLDVYQLCYGKIYYVDPDAAGNNNGSSWADAFNYLQDALAAQTTIPCEIRVAEGIYKPDANSSNPSGTGDRTATFQLINGINLKGGYAGFGQPDPNARDYDLYETTLSGDINAPGDPNDNSYHVVTSSGCGLNTVLEGFTITGGNANGTLLDERGGGMFNYGNSSPTVSDCMFSGDEAGYGGGMSNYGYSGPTVTNCTFSGNSAVQGGGIHCDQFSSPTLINCTFSGNTAAYGAGIHGNNSSSPTITNCTFSDNEADEYGGGMYNTNSSSPVLTNCTFTGNTAGTNGGGMRNYHSSLTVTNCILWGDTPNEFYNTGGSPTITYSDVQGGYGGTGNIDADPCFVGSTADNLRLRPGSSCVEAGNNSEPNLPLTDLDGHPRIIDGDCDEVDVVDMGAYEFNYAYMGDLDYNCSIDFFDFSIFGLAWMTQEGDPHWDWACDMSVPPDDDIDGRDAAILCENWLTQIP